MSLFQIWAVSVEATTTLDLCKDLLVILRLRRGPLEDSLPEHRLEEPSFPRVRLYHIMVGLFVTQM